ncbi:hypothetical protein EUTSA_v10024115mg [Eutrema salsugineum]|uniref:Nucleotide-diphospho-sugar transferase domain-containing protein n=1 Tax=Eutrema salsugineum TaxID=72664 RepID=V4KEI6_EUTSA|nr:hypothetical protein EUTSA_v10024115mg [Eutrema salsugineum]
MAQQIQRSISNRPISLLNRNGLLLLLLLALFVLIGVYLPLSESPLFLFPNRTSSSSSSTSSPSPSFTISDWRDYSLAQAAKFVAKNDTVIVCAVSYPFLPFLNNWLISISRQKHHEKVLVIAEDYATLYKVNEKWPGHAVLIPPALDPQTAHKFGSQGFYNLTSRRPQHLLNILELGYHVMYNDVDMVWLQDPFQYLQGSHDVYFMDDMVAIKPLNHSHDLPPLSRSGVTYVCSCFIFLRSTNGAKLLMKKWVEEIRAQTWSNIEAKKPHDQPAFNRALHKTTHQTMGKHVVVHNNYIVGYDNKMKRFQDFGLWLVADNSHESPLGKLELLQEQNIEAKKQRRGARKQRKNRG